MFGDSGSTWERAQLRTAVNFTYGGVDAHITPSGLWSYDLPDGLDLANLPYANLGPVIARDASAASTVQAPSPAYTAAQAAQWGNNFTLTWRPQMSDDAEQQGKMDFTWDVAEKLPFLSGIQTGFQRRDRTGNGWAGGGLHGAARHRQRGRGGICGAGRGSDRKPHRQLSLLHADGDLHPALPIRLCSRDHGRHQQQPRRQSEQRAVRHDDVHAHGTRRA